jgi:TetR/AcrR family transcriptional regulator
MSRPATVSPARILEIAALEFAERGYAGARVDRIARRARVNKAMLYYHFGSKQALYRALLRQVFTSAAARLREIAGREAGAGQKLHDAIGEIAAFVREHAFFPAIMLREVAEGGAHLDRKTLAALASVPRAVESIVEQGIRVGTLRPVHPVAAYLMMLAPIVMFMAAASIRRELEVAELPNIRALTPDLFVQHIQDFVQRALAMTASGSPTELGRARRTRRASTGVPHARTS